MQNRLATCLLACFALSGCSLIAGIATDPSCTKAGLAAQDDISTFAEEIPGTSEHTWQNLGCKEGGVAALRFHFDGNPEDLGDELRSRGCELQTSQTSRWTCKLDDIEFSLSAAQDLEVGGCSVLATVTSA